MVCNKDRENVKWSENDKIVARADFQDFAQNQHKMNINQLSLHTLGGYGYYNEGEHHFQNNVVTNNRFNCLKM